MIRDLFEIPTDKKDLKPGQRRWLEVVSRLPEIKVEMGDRVHPEDIAVASEASEILLELA
jgi:hypothetical protein